MKNFKILLIFAAILIVSCQKDVEIESVSDCIENAINDFNDTLWICNDASVNEYSFQDVTVYVFDPGTCGADMSGEVMDENCNLLGTLGGISGNNIINGENFSSAIFNRSVWTK